MLSIPPELTHLYEMRLTQKNVAIEQRPRYKKQESVRCAHETKTITT